MKFPKRTSLLPKWTILAKLWSKITQAYISGSVLRTFFEFFSMIGYNKWMKIISLKFPKNFSFQPNGQFQPNCGPKLQIHSKHFFKLCSIIGHNNQRKIAEARFLQKSTFGSHGKFFSQLLPKIMQSFISGSVLRILFKLCSMIGHNKQIRTIYISEISPKILFWAKWTILG